MLLSWLYLREFQTTHCPANRWRSSGSSVPLWMLYLLLLESSFLPPSFKTLSDLWEDLPDSSQQSTLLPLSSFSLGSKLYYFHSHWGSGRMRVGARNWDQCGKWRGNWLEWQYSVMRRQTPYCTEHLIHTLISFFEKKKKLYEMFSPDAALNVFGVALHRSQIVGGNI